MNENTMFTIIFTVFCLYKAGRYFLEYLSTRKLYDIAPAESFNQILLERERLKAEKRRRTSLMLAGGLFGLGIGGILGAMFFSNTYSTFQSQYGEENLSVLAASLIWIACAIALTAASIIATHIIDRKLQK